MMNRRNVILNSFWVVMPQWRITAIVYFFQLCLAMTLGMQVFEVLKSSIGHSLEINKLLIQYDHTVLTDFLKVHGASITPLIGQLRWLLLAWFVFSVFIDAGLLYCTSLANGSEQVAPRSFWMGGAAYFFPFLKISLVFMLLALVWTLLLWVPMALSFEALLQYFPSEQYAVWLVISLLLVYLAGLALLFIGSVLSRLAKIKTGQSIAQSIRTGRQIFRKNTRRLLITMSGFIALQLSVILLYWLLEALIGMTSMVGILTMEVLQQAFVFFRIQLRQMMYVGLSVD